MKEVPILFQREMIQAYMAGRKRMTRRTRGLDEINKAPDDWEYTGLAKPAQFLFRNKKTDARHAIQCPYGDPGETTLWFRENWRKDDFAPDDAKRTIYQADMPDTVLEDCKGIISWKPSIHLPRARARHTSPLLKARVERLQDITEADILAEGVTVDAVAKWCNHPWSSMPTLHHAWRILWESINGLGDWNCNPWVGVYEFEPYKGGES